MRDVPRSVTYERFVYSLPEHSGDLALNSCCIRHSAAFAELTGILTFDHQITLEVWEDLDFANGVITGYSYAVNQAGNRLGSV